jgi:hypothetical protein
MRRRLTLITISSLTMTVTALALAPLASAQSQGDPSSMTLQLSDFQSADLISQSSQGSKAVPGYARLFTNARIGYETLPVVMSEVIVAPNPVMAQQVFGIIAARTAAQTGKQLAKSVAGNRHNTLMRLKVGAPQPLQAGNQGMLIRETATATVRRLVKRRWVINRLRFGLDFAFVRQDVAIEMVAAVGAGATGLDGAVTTLAGDAEMHMKTGLAPSGYVAPTITAGVIPAPGMALTGAASAWTGSSTNESLTFAWERCDQNGLNCVAIPGAVGSSYTLTAADVGSTIRVEVTYENVDGIGAPAVSVPTAVVGS